MGFFKKKTYTKHFLAFILVSRDLDSKWDGRPQWKGDLRGKLYGNDEELIPSFSVTSVENCAVLMNKGTRQSNMKSVCTCEKGGSSFP